MERVLVECQGCGRTYLGAVEGGHVQLLVGGTCVECDGAEFSPVEQVDE